MIIFILNKILPPILKWKETEEKGPKINNKKKVHVLERESKEGGTVTLVYGPLVTAMTKKNKKSYLTSNHVSSNFTHTHNTKGRLIR